MSKKIYQIGIYGDNGVGKHSFILTMKGSRYNNPTERISGRGHYCMFKNKRVDVGFTMIEDLQNIKNYQVEYFDLVVLMYDVSSKKSIEYLKENYEKIHEMNPNAYYLFIGNKYDMKNRCPNDIDYMFPKILNIYYSCSDQYIVSGKVMLGFILDKIIPETDFYNNDTGVFITKNQDRFIGAIKNSVDDISTINSDKNELEKKLKDMEEKLKDMSEKYNSLKNNIFTLFK